MLYMRRCGSYDKLAENKSIMIECVYVNWISDATTHCANQLLSTSYR